MKLHSTIIGVGTPVLILHGFLGMSDNWKTMGNKYAENGFEVHLIDQRNHGRSPHSDDFNYELMAKDVVEYCDSHKLNDVILIGHSMGGKTAMEMALTAPDYLKKLIIVDIAPKYYAPHHQDILEGLAAIKKADLSSRGDAEDILSKYVPDEGTKLFLLKNLSWNKEKKLELRINLEVLTGEIENLGAAISSRDKFDKPTLFIKGEKSNYIKDEDKKQILEQFTDAKIAVIPNAGHWVHAENMEAFYEQTMRFLQE